MDPLFWSVMLLVLGLVLVCAEVFVPSGGILGFLSIVSFLSGILLAFYHRGAEAGLLFLVVTGVAIPAALSVAFRYWPKTPMGRRLLLEVPTAEEVLPDSPQRQWLKQLVGKQGVAKSVMMPSGAVQIEGHTIDALSEGIPIEAGDRIVVIEVRGTRVVVRPLAAGEEVQQPGMTSSDVLSQPLESLGLESLEDPLA